MASISASDSVFSQDHSHLVHYKARPDWAQAHVGTCKVPHCYWLETSILYHKNLSITQLTTRNPASFRVNMQHRKRRHSRWQLSFFCNLMSQAASCHFHIILFVRNQSLAQPKHKGRGLHRSWIVGGRDHWRRPTPNSYSEIWDPHPVIANFMCQLD